MKLAKALHNVDQARALIESELGIAYSNVDIIEYAIEGRIEPVASVLPMTPVDRGLMALEYTSENEKGQAWIEVDNLDDDIESEEYDETIPNWVWVKDSDAAIDPVTADNRLLYIHEDSLKRLLGKLHLEESVVTEADQFYAKSNRQFPIVLEDSLVLALDPRLTTGPNAPATNHLLFLDKEVQGFIAKHKNYLNEPVNVVEKVSIQEKRELVLKGWLAGKGYKLGMQLHEGRRDVWDALNLTAPELFPSPKPAGVTSTIKKFFTDQKLINFTPGKKKG